MSEMTDQLRDELRWIAAFAHSHSASFDQEAQQALRTIRNYAVTAVIGDAWKKGQRP